MSMKDTACSGNTVKASAFTNLLPEEHRERYANACDDCAWETVEEILAEHLPQDFPRFAGVFMLGDEDNPENLDRGVVYVMFDDEDLYVKTPTPAMEAMKAKGVAPEFNRWTVWG